MIVQVTASAICGSDLHFYDGDLPMYPVAPGHEVVGTVVEEDEETVVEVVESRGATARAGLLSSENPASPVPRATQSRGQPRQPAREGGLIASF